jgi:hypothetical protein
VTDLEWREAVKNRDPIVRISGNSRTKSWVVKFDTVTLPGWLTLSDGALDTLRGLAEQLETEDEIWPARISDDWGSLFPEARPRKDLVLLFGPYPTKERAEEIKSRILDTLHGVDAGVGVMTK